MPVQKDHNLKPLMLRINRKRYEDICEISKEYYIPVSSLIRKAIADYIEKEYPIVFERRKARIQSGINTD